MDTKGGRCETGVKPRDFSKHVRRSLFACAYWMAAADAELCPEEQEWFERQFGTEEAGALISEFTAMDPDAVVGQACVLPDKLDTRQKRRLLGAMRPWLLSLAHADSFFAVPERKVLVQVLKRLGGRAPSPLFVVKGSVPKWHHPQPRDSVLRSFVWWSLAVMSVLLFAVTAVTWLIRDPITYSAAAVCVACVLVLMFLDLGR